MNASVVPPYGDPEEERADLLRLCQRYGVADSYHDIWGNLHAVPDHGLRSLLRAMDVEAGSRSQVRASLAAVEAGPGGQAQRSPLPPVVVFWLDAGPWVLTLQAAARDAVLHWELIEEGGARHQGPASDFRIQLPSSLPMGYHRLDLRLRQDGAAADEAAEGGGSRLLATALVVIAPRRCYLPPALHEGRRVWGPAVQLYALRSQRNWGIGDFTDLATLVRLCGAHGAALVGLNPLHALYPHNPEHASPYSPSSRRFYDVLYLDVEAIDDFFLCPQARAMVQDRAFQANLRALRNADLVDYDGVWAAKLPVLELLHESFRKDCPPDSPSDRAHEFRTFQAAGGPALRQHALFEALQEHLHGRDRSQWGWPQWSYAYRNPKSAEVAEFARTHAQRIDFYEYLQWQAELQLGAAGRSALHAQLPVGLYQDLAVSIDQGGAEAWASQDLYAQGASVGCPPDDFNLHGQDWGLLPLIPDRLRARLYAPYIAALRANMRHAGALRLDHVMGLLRLFWVPRGDLPEAGAYVSYPFEHLLGILTLESRRNRCMVIGEDLGTVPDEVRQAMDRSRLLSYRLLVFSHGHDGEFKAPADYPRDALVASSTHDLATLAGYWEGRDIALRQELGLYPSAALRERQIEERRQDRARLLRALEREGLLPPGLSRDPPEPPGPLPPALGLAVQEFLARTPAHVQVVQLEDIFECREQVNVPGTVAEHPNWRRKLPVPLEQWEKDGRFVKYAACITAART